MFTKEINVVQKLVEYKGQLKYVAYLERICSYSLVLNIFEASNDDLENPWFDSQILESPHNIFMSVYAKSGGCMNIRAEQQGLFHFHDSDGFAVTQLLFGKIYDFVKFCYPEMD